MEVVCLATAKRNGKAYQNTEQLVLVAQTPRAPTVQDIKTSCTSWVQRYIKPLPMIIKTGSIYGA